MCRSDESITLGIKLLRKINCRIIYQSTLSHGRSFHRSLLVAAKRKKWAAMSVSGCITSIKGRFLQKAISRLQSQLHFTGTYTWLNILSYEAPDKLAILMTVLLISIM